MENQFSQGPSYALATAAIGTIDVRPYNTLMLDVAFSATTETINLTGTLDGLNFNVGKIRPWDMVTGAVGTTSDFKAGLYKVNVEGFNSIKITKSSTSETVTIRTALGL